MDVKSIYNRGGRKSSLNSGAFLRDILLFLTFQEEVLCACLDLCNNGVCCKIGLCAFLF